MIRREPRQLLTNGGYGVPTDTAEAVPTRGRRQRDVLRPARPANANRICGRAARVPDGAALVSLLSALASPGPVWGRLARPFGPYRRRPFCRGPPRGCHRNSRR